MFTPFGDKPIGEFNVGDAILSADENDPECRVAVRYVEEVHRRFGLVVRLHLGGRTILLTPDHPIFVPERGWVQAGELVHGDLVLGHDGKLVAVDRIEADDRARTVYNLTVSEFHTFFVGSESWGFSVWVHNLTICEELARLQNAIIKGDAKAAKEIRANLNKLKADPAYRTQFEEILKTPEGAKAFGDVGVDVSGIGTPKFHNHHSIPSEIQEKLPPHLQNDPDIIGRKGLPNRMPVEAKKHLGEVHDKIGISPKETGIYGGRYNLRFDEEIRKIGYDKITKQQVLDIRDLLVLEFGL